MDEKLDLIPEKSNIRIKKKDDEFVIFNLETSGFHKVTSDVNEILEKINGEDSIRKISEYFAEKRNLDLNEFQKQLVDFLRELEIRKIIKLNSK